MTQASTRPAPTHRIGSPRVGIVGGGQLARMCQQAAIALDVDVRVLCTDVEEGAGPVTPGARAGPATDPELVGELARHCDVVTVDHELVDLGLLEALEGDGALLRPAPATLRAAVDKLELRRRLADAGLPVVDHLVADAPVEAGKLPAWPHGWVVKTATGGYDGRGVWFPASRAEAAELVDRLTSEGRRVIVERRIPDPTELAVLVARRPGGECVVYDPVRTFQEDGICVGLEAPSGRPAAVDELAREIARDVAELVGSVGILAVEFILADGVPMVSEIAARPHNSGHHTIEATVTSQFENHLRAVLDLPLGSGELVVEGLGMANLLAGSDPVEPRMRLGEGLAADPGAAVHLYSKRPTPGRKLGHVTVVDADPRTGRGRAARVARILGGRDVEPAEEAS